MAKRIAFINPAISTENVGDLFIADSIKRILDFDVNGSFDVDPRKPLDAGTIDRINREADAAVICGTNLWYRRMPRQGRWMISLDNLLAIKVPIIPWGVGTTRHDDDDNDFEPETLAQIRHIHDRCEISSARDVRTARVLERAGVRNAVMTGCPTLFRSLAPTWRLRKPRPGARKVVVTVRKGAARNVRRLLNELASRGLEPVIAAQQAGDNFLARSIPLIRRSVPTLYEYKIKPYLNLIDEAVGVIGWRLHGNMIHLAHGNPAILFANCSRGQSFCETFALPVVPSPDHVDLPESTIVDMVDRLLTPQTFTSDFPVKYAEHRRTMAEFLDANGLRHRLGSDDLPQTQTDRHALQACA